MPKTESLFLKNKGLLPPTKCEIKKSKRVLKILSTRLDFFRRLRDYGRRLPKIANWRGMFFKAPKWVGLGPKCGRF